MALYKENYDLIILDVGRCLRWLQEADTQEDYLYWVSRVYFWAGMALDKWMEENCV